MNTLQNIVKDFKRDLSTRKLILRYISSTKRFVMTLGVLLFIISASIGMYFDNNWMIIPTVGIEIILFIYITRITNKIKQWKYGSSDDFQRIRYDLLIHILRQNNVYHDENIQRTREKLNLLISILNSKVTGYKRSIPLIGFITAITTTLLRLGLDKKYSSDIIISISTLAIMLIGLSMMLLPLVNDLLNKDKNKLEELRNMIAELMVKKII